MKDIIPEMIPDVFQDIIPDEIEWKVYQNK
jgi:hypothetical protein